MSHTLTNVQKGEAVQLLQPIDNRDGRLKMALCSLDYTVGWYNIAQEEKLSWRTEGVPAKQVTVPPGLWSFHELQKHIQVDDISIEVSRTNGLVTLSVPGELEVMISDGLLRLLGLDDGRGGDWLNPGIYVGDRPVGFSPTKTLRIHLEQLSTSGNNLDGCPSTLLASVGVGVHGFGQVASIGFVSLEFKRLVSGTIGELKLSIRDDSGRVLDNHDLPIEVGLVIA